MSFHERENQRPRSCLAARSRLAVVAVTGLVVLVTGCGSHGAKDASPALRGHLADATVGSHSTASYGLVTAAPHAPRSGRPGRSGGSGRKPVNSGGPMRTGAPPAGTSQLSGVTGGAMFGGNQMLVPEQHALGRKLAIVRVYYTLGDRFPRRLDTSFMAQGSTLLVSLDLPRRGPGYASVAAGREDAAFGSFLRAVNAAAIAHHLAAIYFDFEHEANLPYNQHFGSPAEFVKAWDHLHALAARAKLNWQQGGRIHWALILTRPAYIPMAQRRPWEKQLGDATAYWPGRSADIAAVDGYSFDGCHHVLDAPAVSVADVFNPAVAFAKARGVPLFIAEWGATTYPAASHQTRFIQQMPSYVTANPIVRAALYWNEQGHIGPHCNFAVNHVPASVAAMRKLGHLGAMQGRTG